jgi:hypothetical protein
MDRRLVGHIGASAREMHGFLDFRYFYLRVVRYRTIYWHYSRYAIVPPTSNKRTLETGLRITGLKPNRTESSLINEIHDPFFPCPATSSVCDAI